MVGVKAEPGTAPAGVTTRRQAAAAAAAATTMTRRRSAELAAAAAGVKAEPVVAAAAAASPAKRRSSQRGKAAAAAAAPAKRPKRTAAPAAGGRGGRSTKRGLGGTRAPPPAGRALGVVDPQAGVDGAICVDEEGLVYDVVLVLRDAAANSDKYFLLQLIGATDGRYVVFSHWGRTGTAGQCQSVDFAPDGAKGGGGADGDDDSDSSGDGEGDGGGGEAGLAAALDAFSIKFTDKTGLPWDALTASGGAPPVPGKYRVVAVDHRARAAAAAASASPRWQYWVDDGVDGKPTGWYDYDAAGGATTEALYVEWGLNAWLTERVVQSGSWAYLVNLADMSQTNLEHFAHTRRRIRRVPPGVVPDQTPPL